MPTISDASNNNNKQTRTVSQTTVLGLGDYVARGFGLHQSSDDLVTSATELPSSDPSSNGTTNTTSHGSTAMASQDMPSSWHKSDPVVTTAALLPSSKSSNLSSLQFTTIKPSNSSDPVHKSASSDLTAVATPQDLNASTSPTLFANMTFTGNCWEQWNQFWAANESLTASIALVPTSTYSTTYEYGVDMLTKSLYTSWTIATTTEWAAGFPINTYAYSSAVRGYSVSYASSEITTVEITDYKEVTVQPNATITPPACALSSSVPQCQSGWEHWASAQILVKPSPSDCDPFTLHGSADLPETCSDKLSTWSGLASAWSAGRDAPPPLCPQASLGSEVCRGLRSSYISDASSSHNRDANDGVLGMVPFTITVNGSETWEDVWPDKTSFAPGCTLGCGGCALKGGPVELIYWQPAYTTWVNGHFSTLPDNRTGPVTVVTLGTTLTSPTVYMSFKSIWARNSCSRFRQTFVNTIIAITDTSTLQSLHGYGRYDGKQETASFNFTDLYVRPVPEYIFMSQPRCGSSYSAYPRGLFKGPIPLPSNWTCPRTLEYEPVLAIPLEVRSLDPSWASCSVGYQGAYDPPLALQPADAIVLPTKPVAAISTTSAAPASAPDVWSVSRTITASTSSKPTVKPDPPEELSSDPQQQDGEDPSSGKDDLPQQHDEHEAQGPADALDPDDSSEQEPDKPGVKSSAERVSPLTTVQPINEPSADTRSPEDPASPSAEGGGLTTQAAYPSQTESPANAAEVLQAALSSVGNANDPVLATQSDLNSAVAPSDGTSGPGGHEDPAPKLETAGVGEHDSNSQQPPGTGSNTGPTKTAVWTKEGKVTTALVHGEFMTLEADGASATIAAGTTATFNGQTVYLSPNLVDIVHDGVIDKAYAGDLAPPSNAMAVWSDDGQVYTAMAGDGSIVIHAKATSTAIGAGETATFNGHVINVPATAGAIVYDGTTFTLLPSGHPTTDDQWTQEALATWTEDGQTFSAQLDGEDIVIKAAGSSATIPVGSTATIAGQTLNALAPTMLIHNGVTMTLTENYHIAASPDMAVWTHDHQTFSAPSRDGEMAVVAGAETTFSVAQGSIVTIAGQTVSVQSEGHFIVMDGTTVSVTDAGTDTGTKQAATSTSSATSIDTTSTVGPEGAGSRLRVLSAWIPGLMLVCIALM